MENYLIINIIINVVYYQNRSKLTARYYTYLNIFHMFLYTN